MTRVDSFLVRDGRSIRPDLHRRRFGAGYPDLGPVPPRGSWFPRVTDHGVEWRPAPALRSATVLWLPEESDPRTSPTVKGPDLPALLELRERARGHGADDAVLLAPGAEPCVREAATSALVFFSGGVPIMAPRGEILESTTVCATVEAGLLPEPRRREITVDEALTLPAWAASALHGWTPVVGWIRGGTHHPAQRRSAPHGGAAARGDMDPAALNAALWAQAEELTRP